MIKTIAASGVAPKVDDLLIGNSSAMVMLRALIMRVAPSRASVMITGPSGSGKEMVARALHRSSDRADKPFVAINCGAIPADLIESELFGHERGSFTGAIARRIGRFEEADGGTLFLDEIGDMRFDMQVKLLRVLEDGIVTRIGGTAATPVDVRIICATHQDVTEAVRDHRFREDLYFRLGVIMIGVPGLAAHHEDIPLLVTHFQQRSKSRTPATFSPDALARLQRHDWRGNVRELRNVVERGDILFPGDVISAQDCDSLLGTGTAAIRPARSRALSAPHSNAEAPDSVPINLRVMLETMELENIQMALDMADGVISDAARMLTLKRTTLIEKMRKYGVDRVC